MGWPSLSTVGDLFDIASTGMQMYSSYTTAVSAKESASLQKEQLARSAEIEAARVKREARVRSAQLLAAQGRSGATTSTSTEGVYGIESSLTYGLDDLSTQTQLQSEQFDLAASQTRDQAMVNMFTSLGTFAASDTGKRVGEDFTSFLNGDTDA